MIEAQSPAGKEVRSELGVSYGTIKVLLAVAIEPVPVETKVGVKDKILCF